MEGQSCRPFLLFHEKKVVVGQNHAIMAAAPLPRIPESCGIFRRSGAHTNSIAK